MPPKKEIFGPVDLEKWQKSEAYHVGEFLLFYNIGIQNYTHD